MESRVAYRVVTPIISILLTESHVSKYTHIWRSQSEPSNAIKCNVVSKRFHFSLLASIFRQSSFSYISLFYWKNEYSFSWCNINSMFFPSPLIRPNSTVLYAFIRNNKFLPFYREGCTWDVCQFNRKLSFPVTEYRSLITQRRSYFLL